MQYHLSTLFLIFFFVAATLSWLGTGGICLLCFSLLLAFGVHHKNARLNLIELLVLIAIMGICVALLLPVVSESREKHRMAKCVDNLRNIGEALHGYHTDHGHFPMATIKDKKGQPLRSWRLEIMPELGYQGIYDQLNKDEPWDSTHNLKIVNQNQSEYSCVISEYSCPSDAEKNPANSANYLAVIGPGTAWHEDKPIQASKLPDSGAHTVMAVETCVSGKNWAEPDNLTVEELVEKLKITPGAEKFSCHTAHLHILMADGSVWCILKDTPISLWEKLLAGEVKSIDELNPDMNDSDSICKQKSFIAYNASFLVRATAFIGLNGPSFCAFLVWLLSLFLLFRRAIKSRIKQETLGACGSQDR